MFYKIDNFLDKEELEFLCEVARVETSGENICHAVPAYQSFSHMHVKYKLEENFNSSINKIVNACYDLVKIKTKIKRCWFNATREGSNNYRNHTHKEHTKFPVAVLYLDGCENNGTYFTLGNAELIADVKDNTLLFFDNELLHRTPNWNGKERYSMAIVFEE